MVIYKDFVVDAGNYSERLQHGSLKEVSENQRARTRQERVHWHEQRKWGRSEDVGMEKRQFDWNDEDPELRLECVCVGCEYRKGLALMGELDQAIGDT